jgi:hypothetical protein
MTCQHHLWPIYDMIRYDAKDQKETVKHASQITAGATVLLEPDNTQRKKLPHHISKAFLTSIPT